MRVLFLHQNFPGQYRHVSAQLAASGHEVVAIGQRRRPVAAGVRRLLYKPLRAPSKETHHYLREAEGAVLNGQAVARLCLRLQHGGFKPDIVIGHNGWGETLFVKDVWPDVPLLGYFEFFYRARGVDVGFDPEFPVSLETGPRVRVQNTINLLGLDSADWGQTPTRWQCEVHPPAYRSRLSVIHDGIDTDAVHPDPNATLTLPSGATLRHGDEVITYATRNLEPYRGFHVFMRALPEVLRRRPRAQVLIAGADEVSYGHPLPPNETYRAKLLNEVGPRLDMARVHFLGRLPYERYLRVLQVSAVHVYLTYPFVLSWSMLEAMAAGCAVVGSATPPVAEVIEDGRNGLLVDFFDQRGLADRIDAVLDHADGMATLRAAARQTIVERYDLKRVCLPRYLELIHTLREGRLPQTAPQPVPDGREA